MHVYPNMCTKGACRLLTTKLRLKLDYYNACTVVHGGDHSSV